MARTTEDIERYVFASHIPAEQVAPGTWVMRDPQWGGAQIVVYAADPLVVFRAKVCDVRSDLPPAQRARLFEHLLRLNGTEMLQGAYALEGESVVAVEVMQLENLDQNEFLAAIDSLSLALGSHGPGLAEILAH
jgi:hypothetical protein